MKATFRHGLSILMTILMLVFCIGVFAYAEPYSDIEGHWAEETLKTAVDDGLINGFEDGTIRPDSNITTAQMVTLMCRVLHASEAADISSMGIPEGIWYYSAAGQALKLGIIDGSEGSDLDVPCTRAQAMTMMARAFQINEANPDYSCVKDFSDASSLSGEPGRAIVSLVKGGFVEGSGGALNLNGNITRAEFLTILYRLAGNYYSEDSSDNSFEGGSVISGSYEPANVTGDRLWYDCSTGKADLSTISADTVVVRSEKLSSLTLGEGTDIDRLVLACVSGPLDVSPQKGVNTAVVGTGSGNVNVGGGVTALEVTGDNRTVTVSSGVKTVTVSGSGNTINIASAAALDNLVILGNNNRINVADAKSVDISGDGNTVVSGGKTDNLKMSGTGNRFAVTTDGNLGTANIGGQSNVLEVNGTASAVTVSDAASPEIKGGGTVDKLTTDKTTGSLNIGVRGGINTLVVGEGSGDVNIGGGVNTAQISGSDMKVVLSGNLKSLTVSGSKNAVTAYSGTAPDTLAVSGSNNYLTMGDVSSVSIAGSGNTVISNSKTDTLKLAGNHNRFAVTSSGTLGTATVTGDANALEVNGTAAMVTATDVSSAEIKGGGTIDKLVYDSVLCKLSANVKDKSDPVDHGIMGMKLTLSSDSVLPAGKTLAVTGKAENIAVGRYCTYMWYVDDKLVSSGNVTLNANSFFSMNHAYTYTKDMKLSSTVKLVLKYTFKDSGKTQEISASRTITLKNYPSSHFSGITPAQALATVKTGYKGNYTLSWAQNHDYSSDMKEIWINAKGYSSRTKYLIWVNLTYQRVNIFQGSKGSWALIRTNIVGTGAPGTGTPVGVYKIWGKQSGWFTPNYTVYPVVRFYDGSGYAFHSRLYMPGSKTQLKSAAIGYPISHGCVRMYTSDVQWIYNNCPIGTTVVVY